MAKLRNIDKDLKGNRVEYLKNNYVGWKNIDTEWTFKKLGFKVKYLELTKLFFNKYFNSRFSHPAYPV